MGWLGQIESGPAAHIHTACGHLVSDDPFPPLPLPRLQLRMVEFARRLCSEGHEQAEIGTRQRAILQRRERVKQSAVDRRNKLEDCRKLMVFLQNCMEVRMYAKIHTLTPFQL